MMEPESNTARRSRSEKRLAVENLLADPVWTNRSSRWIAKHLGISNHTVELVRTSRHLPGVFASESECEASFIEYLRECCRRCPRCQIYCSAGIIDLVDRRTVYEVERVLTRPKIFEAVGQALIYREAFDCSRNAAIVGAECGGTGRLIEAAANVVDVYLADQSGNWRRL